MVSLRALLRRCPKALFFTIMTSKIDSTNLILDPELEKELNDLEKRKREVEEAYARIRSRVVAQVQQVVDNFGLTDREIHLHAAAAQPSKGVIREKVGKLEPAYIGPNGEKWSGRGKTPRWLREAEESGASRESFRVKP